MKKIVPVIILLLAVIAISAFAFAADVVPAAGSKAPDFTLKSQEDKAVSLHDFKGQWVVLYFYPKDQTPGCTIEAHNFQADQDRYTALHAAIVGVSADTVSSHQEWCTKDNLTFKMLADPDQKVINMYGSFNPTRKLASRNTFLIDPQGTIRKVYTGVDPNPHSKDVLFDLAVLGAK